MRWVEVKIKKLHPDAVVPTYAKLGDAGMDLYAVDMEWDEHGNFVYRTGLSMEIPEGHVGLVFPRSSISKTPHSLRNSVGVIDSGYRGEIILKFGGNSHPTTYDVGDRVAQIIIMPFPEVRFVESLELTETERGSGGFGSTGAS
tara:strand:- start:1289 stop:1720 length:432 start_codon:yes stop_codon:yes gene_type:complete